MEANKKLFIVFRCVTYDILFYYTLETMFLTLIKGYSFSQVLFITSVDLLFVTLLTFPLNYMLRKVSILNRLRIGIIAFILYFFAFMYVQNFYILCVLTMLKAVGGQVLALNSTSLLKVICKDSDTNEVSKLEGRASAAWWIMEASSAMIAGYLFQFNPYISYYISSGLLLIGFITTYFIKISKEDNYIQEKRTIRRRKESALQKDLAKTLKRLAVAISLVAFAFWGAAETFASSAQLLLQYIGATSVVMGWVYCAVKILTAGVNMLSFKIEKKLGWKFLPISITGFMCSIILMTVTFFIPASFAVKLVFMMIGIAVMYVTRNPYRLNIKNTMTNCFSGTSLERVYSYYFLAENLGGTIFSLLASFIVEQLNLGFAFAISLGVILIVLVPSLIMYVTYYKKAEQELLPTKIDVAQNNKVENKNA